MAAVSVTATNYGQKIPRNTQVVAQEDAWTVTTLNNSGNETYLILRPSVDTLYHSVSGQAASDGIQIPGGGYFPIRLGATTVFYLRPAGTAGVIDSFVAPPAMAPLEPYKSFTADLAGALTQGNSLKPTYCVDSVTGAPTAAGYVHLAVESGPTKTTRLRRLIISNPGLGTAAALLNLELVRTTAAGSVGTVVTPSVYDTAVPDAAHSGVSRKDGSTITAGTIIHIFSIFQPATAAGAFSPFVYDFYGQLAKALTIPSGTANGIALRCTNGNPGAAGFSASFEFTEE